MDRKHALLSLSICICVGCQQGKLVGDRYDTVGIIMGQLMSEVGKYAVVSSVLMAIIRQCGIYNNRIIYNKVVAKKAYGTGKLDNLLVTAKVLHTKK